MRVPVASSFVLFTTVLVAVLPAQRDRGPQKPVELTQFTWQVKKFASTSVKKDMPYGVFLPKGYDDEANKKTTYPLVIWLHGMFEDHNRFHDRGGAPVLDKAVADGKLPPCIFVCANGGSTSAYVNRKDEKWEDLITKDLLDHLTQNYRVAAERDKRALMGISMGGMAALKIGFVHPDMFGCIAVHSSAVFPEDPDKLPERIKGMASRIGLDEVFGNPIDKTIWAQTNPLCLAAKVKPEALHGLRIYFDAGTNDRLELGAANQKLHEMLDQQKVAHTWELVEGGGHAWGSGFKGESLTKSLSFVGQAFRGEAAAAKDGKDKEPAKAKDEAPAKPADKAAGNGH